MWQPRTAKEAAVFFGSVIALCAGAAPAAVTGFPAPDGLAPSPHYRIEVQTGDGWKPSYVCCNPARTDGWFLLLVHTTCFEF